MARTGASALRPAAAALMFWVLMAAGALSAAGQPAAPAGVSAVPDRTTYLQRAEAEMNGWRLKLHGMEDKAEANLRTAWNRTEADARNLRTATAAGWDEARSSYEQASRDLQHAWDKSRL